LFGRIRLPSICDIGHAPQAFTGSPTIPLRRRADSCQSSFAVKRDHSLNCTSRLTRRSGRADNRSKSEWCRSRVRCGCRLKGCFYVNGIPLRRCCRLSLCFGLDRVFRERIARFGSGRLQERGRAHATVACRTAAGSTGCHQSVDADRSTLACRHFAAQARRCTQTRRLVFDGNAPGRGGAPFVRSVRDATFTL